LGAGGIQRQVDFTRCLVVACFEVLLHGLTQLACDEWRGNYRIFTIR